MKCYWGKHFSQYHQYYVAIICVEGQEADLSCSSSVSTISDEQLAGGTAEVMGLGDSCHMMVIICKFIPSLNG